MKSKLEQVVNQYFVHILSFSNRQQTFLNDQSNGGELP